jgi:hypothetical protein
MATQTSLNVVQSAGTPATDIPLPKWNDFSSVLTYITSIVSIGVGFVAVLKPGFSEPAAVRAAIPAVALLVATGAQIFNAASHRSAHNAAAVATINQGQGTVAPAPTRAAKKAARTARTEVAKTERTPVQITSASPLPAAVAGTSYAQTLTATGGIPPITWASAGNMGSLKLDRYSGVVSGAATDMVNGPDLVFTVTATDSSAPPESVQKDLSLHTG